MPTACVVAFSATVVGETIIRGTVARDVAALMEYKGLSLKEAASVGINDIHCHLLREESKGQGNCWNK